MPSRSRRDRARTNSSRASFRRKRSREHSRLEPRQRLALTLQRAQRRLDEELAADERRHRVAGQPEHERLTAHAERHRLARLDRDAPEHLLDAELGLDRAHEVVRTDRDAARRDENVRREAALERLPVCGLVVGDRRQRLDVGTGGGERGRQHETVRLVDLPGCELRSGRASSLPVARIATRGRRAHATAARPAAARAPSCAGSKTDARVDDHVAASSVAAARTNVRADRNRFTSFDLVVTMDNILEGEDGIGAVGDDTAGRDLHRLAGLERARRRAAGGDPLDHRERPGQVSGPNREAVHGGARERRQVDESARGLGRDAARRVPDSHLLGREHLRPGEHERLRLLESE